jgi:glucose dehydrogenase
LISRIDSLAIVTLLLAGCLPALRGDSISRGEWPNYGNDAGGSRHLPLTQIDGQNVARLRVAWTYRTGESVGVPGPWLTTPSRPRRSWWTARSSSGAPSGKQFLVIAAGGHTALRTKMGDHIVAFGLP